MQASKHQPGTAYLVADGHRLDDETPYLWKTANYGNNWTRLGMNSGMNALDREVYLHVVREDPKVPGLLYLGTERGVMFSRDDGNTWQSLRLNMPTVAIADLVVADDDLVVGTLGRSAWILDDLTPIRDMTLAVQRSAAFLFPVPKVIGWYKKGSPIGSKEGAGSNPPAGVMFTYWIQEKPQKPIRLEVLDANGNLVRTLSSELKPQYTDEDHTDWDPTTELEPDLPAKQGFNRAAWDMNYAQTKWVDGTRNDGGEPKSGPTVLPGD